MEERPFIPEVVVTNTEYGASSKRANMSGTSRAQHRAQANRECLAVMNQRELANEEYCDQMYRDAEQQLGEIAAG